MTEGLVLGLDIGGTSSRARLSSGGRTLAEASGPGANVAVITPRQIQARLTALITELGSPRPAACCAGAAGAEIPAGRRRLERLLARLLPGSRLEVVHDARLVLAAAGLDSGIALIAGTGSVAYGRDAAGGEVRVGGWGWLLGDEGSAVWMVREGARELMLRRESDKPPGALAEAMLAATRSRETLELTGKLHAMREPGRWAALARAVFEAAASDEGAAGVIERAADALVALVDRVRKQLGVDGPVVLAGGLLLNQPRLEELVKARVGDAVSLADPPVAGAVRIAERL